MSTRSIPLHIQESLRFFLENTKQPQLIATYLKYIEEKLTLEPMLFIKDKIVFKSAADAVRILESQDKLWRETEIKVGYVKSSVDDLTSKIYICPFTGKVFGNNTHPNPQDAIYEWVANCPENKERIGGVKVKRFFISEDPKLIASYAAKFAPKAPITKIVYSSAINGKLFHSKEAVIEDMQDHYLKKVSLVEVLEQSKFQIETSFMQMIEENLKEDRIAAFVEAMGALPQFEKYVDTWLGQVEQDQDNDEKV